jgi:hypothetical protein
LVGVHDGVEVRKFLFDTPIQFVDGGLAIFVLLVAGLFGGNWFLDWSQPAIRIRNVRIWIECRSSMFPSGQIIMAFWPGLEYDDFNSSLKEPPCPQIPPNDGRRPATNPC